MGEPASQPASRRFEPLAHARARRGFTQHQLSDLSGVSVDQIKRLEAGLHVPQLRTAYALVGALNTTEIAGLPSLDLEDVFPALSEEPHEPASQVT